MKMLRRGIIGCFPAEGNQPPHPKRLIFKIYSGKCEQFLIKAFSIHEQQLAEICKK